MLLPHIRAKYFHRDWRQGLIVAVLAALFAAATVHYARSERFFYFWDNFAYNRATLESLGALQAPNVSWAHHLRVSMQSGFSQLFTITLAPLMSWFGESRVVYITGIVVFYLLPCAGLCTLVINRIIPLQRWEWSLVFTACATLPVFWRAALAGYPDIGGIAIALVAILLIIGDLGYRKWTTACYLGVTLALTFLFRRHLVYCIIPLMAATTCCSLGLSIGAADGRRISRALGTVARIALTTALTVLIIWLAAPNYFSELISTNYRELYLPFQFPISDVWLQHRNYIGIAYWLLGLTGLIWGIFRTGKPRWICALLLSYLVLSVCIWVFYLRYHSVQYNLHFAVVIAIGNGLLVASVSRQWGRLLPSVLLVMIFGALWLDRLAFIRFVPAAVETVLPIRLAPLINPDYDEIKRLIVFLRDRAIAPHNNILVAASSGTINSDLLTVGEGALFGRNHRQMTIMNGSHADTVQPYSLRDMIAADWIVVASPFQHHLRVEDQGVVLAIYEAMQGTSTFAKDFQQLDTSFKLSGEIILLVYQRIRPAAYFTQVEAARNVFDTVGISDAWTGPFMIGAAATGAEYFDARLIVPSSPHKYTADLEQIRMRQDQSELTLFARLLSPKDTGITGRLGGFNSEGIDLIADFFPENSIGSAPTWSQKLSFKPGEKFSIALPKPDRGVVALRFIPLVRPDPGAALGLKIENLMIEKE